MSRLVSRTVGLLAASIVSSRIAGLSNMYMCLVLFYITK